MVGCSFSSKSVLGQEKHSGDECHTLAPIFRLNTISPQIVFAWNTEVTDRAIPLAIFRWQVQETPKTPLGSARQILQPPRHRCHDSFQPHLFSGLYPMALPATSL